MPLLMHYGFCLILFIFGIAGYKLGFSYPSVMFGQLILTIIYFYVIHINNKTLEEWNDDSNT